MTSSLERAAPGHWSARWRAARWFGWALAIASSVAGSIVTPLTRGMVIEGVDPIFLLLMRLSIAVALIGFTMALTQPDQFRLDRQGLWRVLGVGLIAGLEICCFFQSLAYVDASMSAMIKSTQPLVVLLLLMFGGERLTPRHLARLALATAGIYLLVGPGGTVEFMGLLFLTGSLLLYGAQLVFIQWWLGGYNMHTVNLYLNGVMTAVIALWWWLQGAVWTEPGTQGWLIILVLAVVSTWFARLAIYGAIARIGSGQLALLWPLQTLLILILSAIFLHERMTTIQWLGSVLVLGSAMMAMERIGPKKVMLQPTERPT